MSNRRLKPKSRSALVWRKATIAGRLRRRLTTPSQVGTFAAPSLAQGEIPSCPLQGCCAASSRAVPC